MWALQPHMRDTLRDPTCGPQNFNLTSWTHMCADMALVGPKCADMAVVGPTCADVELGVDVVLVGLACADVALVGSTLIDVTVAEPTTIFLGV